MGDLDLKSPEGGKAEYWRRTERRLIDGGWYTATEKAAAGRMRIKGGEEICLLSKRNPRRGP